MMMINAMDQIFPEDFKFFGDGTVIYPPVLILKPGQIEIGESCRIDCFSRIEGGTGVRIGHHTHISSFSSVYAGGSAFIGNYVGIAQGARIITGSGFPFEDDFPVMFSMRDPYFRTVAMVTIGDYAIIGSNSVVLPGVSVMEGSVLAAGSVATQNIPPWTIWAGVPAKYLRDRARPCQKFS